MHHIHPVLSRLLDPFQLPHPLHKSWRVLRIGTILFKTLADTLFQAVSRSSIKIVEQISSYISKATLYVMYYIGQSTQVYHSNKYYCNSQNFELTCVLMLLP